MIALVAVAAAVPATGHLAAAASTALSSFPRVFDGNPLEGIPAKVRSDNTKLSLKNAGAFPVDPQLVRMRGAQTDAVPNA